MRHLAHLPAVAGAALAGVAAAHAVEAGTAARLGRGGQRRRRVAARAAPPRLALTAEAARLRREYLLRATCIKILNLDLVLHLDLCHKSIWTDVS